MVEVETSCVANSGADLQWRKFWGRFAVEGICTLPRAAVRSPGTNHPSCTPSPLLKILSSASTFYVFECRPLSKATNLKHCNKSRHNIPFPLLIVHPPATPQSLIWPQTLCGPGPAQLEPPLCIFYCIWSRPSLDRILCCIYSWDISAVYFVFHILLRVPSTGFCVQSLYFMPNHLSQSMFKIVMVHIVNPKLH